MSSFELAPRLYFGVGQIVGSYEWTEEFGDVDGSNLQHLRRVRWLWDGRGNPQAFQTYALKQGDTTQKLNEGPVTQWLAELQVPDAAHTDPLADLRRSRKTYRCRTFLNFSSTAASPVHQLHISFRKSGNSLALRSGINALLCRRSTRLSRTW